VDTALQDPFVGRLLDGRYRVESRIARGGMATVYLGVDDRLDREVALKIMHSHLADDPAFVSRFIREARAAARLSHPNVVQVFDQGSDGPVLYLAMEYLPGRTLRDALNERGALSPRQSLTVLEPVLDALGAAHRSGIVHRDIKPENVILTDDGRIKVADFGLARAASAATSSSGVLLGTVAYLAPELVARGIADARADVYASGIMLFEMLTGRQPFTGEMPAQIAFRHVHEDVPPPSSLVPYLPEELDVLTRLATSRDADARPADATAMLGLTRGVRRQLAVEVLDRVPEHTSSGGSTIVNTPHGIEPTEVVGPPGEHRRPGGANGYPASHADTIVGHELIPAGELIGRDLAHDGYDEDDPRDDEETRNRRGPQSYWWSVLLAVIFLVGLGLWWFHAGPGAYTEVPEVADKPAASAESTLAAAGFTVGNDAAYDDTVAKGNIIETRPRGGSEARNGSRVTMIVSLGRETAVVPSVSKKSVDAATAALKRAGFTVGGTTEKYSDSVGDGLVIGTAPKAKTDARIDTPVTLIVSRGPQPVSVPNVVGKSRDDAEKRLRSAGLRVKTDQRYDEKVPAGVVISQQPKGGKLLPGETVAIVVSQGPPLVDVPDVRDKPLREAQRMLRKAGFDVRVQGTHLLDRVFQQSPDAGQQAPRGSTVTVTTF
jgi:beta-lactam-binding protein with PASTA domain/serine/threonine protein kinase